jgi:ATP-binding cassette, subfamily B, bacterial MsbA
MNAYRRLYQFIRPFRSTLVFSGVLLILAGIFEAATTSLSIPLFDKVLAGQEQSAEKGIKSEEQQAYQEIQISEVRAITAKMKALGKKQDEIDAELVKLGLKKEKKTQDFASIQRFTSFFLSFLPGTVITQLSLALLIFTLLKGVSLYYSNYSMSHVGQSVVTSLRNQLFSHVLGQSMGFFSLNSTGRLMSRMSGDVEQVQEAVSTILGDFFREAMLLVALIALTMWIDWKLALLSLLIAPFVLALTLGMGRRIRQVSRKGREDAANLNDQLQQSITGMRIIKAFGMEGHEQQRFEKNSFRLFRSNMRAAAIMFINSPLMEFIGVLAFIPLLYYAHWRIVNKTLTLGMFGGSLFTLFRMYDPIRKLSRIHVQFQRSLASGSRIIELLDEHMEINDRPDARVLTGVYKSIEFRNVSFDYFDQNGETQVLRDICLKVNRNQVIAFVGSSGSGKTTLVGLIPRFHDPTAGAILIDGTDIREYTQYSLRSQIAIVTQETFLFNDTVRNNIGYGDVNANENRIMEAARAALADDFIRNFPMKYETMIGERGQRLSGGERQRISIARALLKNAPILILDEATSALDSESEKLVQQALTNLIRDRTTFVIAHRLSTIRDADRIIVIEQGRIVESGTHDSLMASDGPYRKFFRLQTDESYSGPAKAMESEA